MRILPPIVSKKPILARCLALPLILIFCTPVSAQSLTADDAARLAVGRPEAATLLDAPVERAEGDLQTARTLPNPVATVEREGVEGFGGDGSETILSLEQTLDFSGRRSFNARGAEADVKAARLTAITQATSIGVEARRRYFGLVAAREQLEIATRYSGEIDALLAQTSRREEAGDAARYDVERVRQEALAADIGKTEAETAAFTAEQLLAELTGPAALEGATLIDELLPIAAPADYIDLARSPAMSALQAEAEAAGWRKQSASKFMPDVTIGAGVRQIEGPFESTGVLFSMSVPLPLFDRNEGEYRARSADVREAEARLSLTEARLQSEIASLRNRLETLTEAARRYDEGALSSATELRQIALASFNGGEIAVFEVIDALQSAREAELRSITLKHSAREAALGLAELLPETKQ